MSCPKTVQHNGILTSQPAGGNAVLGSTMDAIQTSFGQTLVL